MTLELSNNPHRIIKQPKYSKKKKKQNKQTKQTNKHVHNISLISTQNFQTNSQYL